MIAATAWFSVIGLCLDILGAILLVRGILLRDMAAHRAMRPMMESEPTPHNWPRRFALYLAYHLGPKDIARASSGRYTENYTDTVWGLLLLVIGFVLQLIGQVIAR